MSNVIRLSDFTGSDWAEIFTFDGPSSTLQVLQNKRTGQMEIVQMNDEGEAIRSQLSEEDASLLRAALSLRIPT